MKKQQGFTLIELIVVIVILGILAATAMPKFIDLSTDAKKAAVQGVAGALSSAGTINYGARILGASSTAFANGMATSGVNCNTLAPIMDGGTIPAGYVFGGIVPNCTVDLTPPVPGIAAVSATVAAVL